MMTHSEPCQRVIPSCAEGEGPLSRGNRYSSYLEGPFENQSTLARSLTSFGMTEGGSENEILR
jgi:hypothetical protein